MKWIDIVRKSTTATKVVDGWDVGYAPSTNARPTVIKDTRHRLVYTPTQPLIRRLRYVAFGPHQNRCTAWDCSFAVRAEMGQLDDVVEQ